MFSIVIPLYNKAHTIEQTLKTVFAQTFNDYEIIIINDGSIDNGVETIKKYTTDFPIVIIDQKNQGVSAARNRGIAEAKHDYIAFLDGDDEWLPLYLEKMKQAIDLFPNCGLFLSGRFNQNYTTRERKSTVPDRYKNKITKIEYFQNPHVFSHISATVVKSSLLKQSTESFGGFIVGQSWFEDFTFLTRIALHAEVVYCGENLSIYNGEVAGQTTTVIDQKELEGMILFHNITMEEWMKTERRNKVFKIFKKYEIRHYILTKIQSGKYDDIRFLISHLHPKYKQFFYSWEWNRYMHIKSKKVMTYFILFTKILWRMHNYPRVQ